MHPKGGAGNEGNRRCGEERGSLEGQQWEGEEHRTILRLLFLGEGDGGAAASSFPHLSHLIRSNRRSCRQNKVNMFIKTTLRLFVSVLTSAAQCWTSCTFASDGSSLNGNVMFAMVDVVVSLLCHSKKGNPITVSITGLKLATILPAKRKGDL